MADSVQQRSLKYTGPMLPTNERLRRRMSRTQLRRTVQCRDLAHRSLTSLVTWHRDDDVTSPETHSPCSIAHPPALHRRRTKAKSGILPAIRSPPFDTAYNESADRTKAIM